MKEVELNRGGNGDENGCTLRVVTNNYSKGNDMPDYDIYWEGSLGEKQVLWHFEENVHDEVDDECELWDFSLLDEDAA